MKMPALLIIIVILSWAIYAFILKSIASRLSWPVSMLLFVLGYSLTVGLSCLACRPSFQNSMIWLWPMLAGILCGVGAVAFFKGLEAFPGSKYFSLVGLYIPLSSLFCIFFLSEPFNLKTILGIFFAGAAILLLA